MYNVTLDVSNVHLLMLVVSLYSTCIFKMNFY